MTRRFTILGLILLVAGTATYRSTVTQALDTGSTKAQFLVAGRHLIDPNFAGTVVLMLAHDKDGAMGVVVNRPTKVEPRELLADIDNLDQYDGHVYMGGPVAVNALLILIRRDQAPDESDTVFDDLHVSGSLRLLENLAGSGDGSSSLRLYVGHAGWGPGQLDGELARGDWFVVPATADMVFHTDPDAVWKKLLPLERALHVNATPLSAPRVPLRVSGWHHEALFADLPR